MNKEKGCGEWPLKSVPTYPTLITTFFLRKGSHFSEGVGRDWVEVEAQKHLRSAGGRSRNGNEEEEEGNSIATKVDILLLSLTRVGIERKWGEEETQLLAIFNSFFEFYLLRTANINNMFVVCSR